MRKPIPTASSHNAGSTRAIRKPNGKSRVMPEDGVTIAGGSNAPRIAVAQWLDAAMASASTPGATARAVPGGAQAAAVTPSQVRTVALSDGTRITFAVAKTPQELEPA
jgi:hypothetical protein